MNLGEFLSPEAGQKRTKALNSTINDAMRFFLGPTGIDRRVQVANELINPVVGISQAATHTKTALDPSKSGRDRALAGGMALGEVLGVAAPAVAHRVAGKSADEIAGTMQDVLTGINSTPSAVAGREFAGNESGAIRAFHGSPHDFDKFSMDKIGTGEGAQAYGHGLYFAEAEDTARAYRDALQFPRIDGAATPVEKVADDLNYHRGNVEAVRAAYQGMLERGTPEAKAMARENLDALPEALDRFKGRMYEVNIDANPEDFLDWDAPLSAQPEGVRPVLSEFERNMGGPQAVRDMTLGSALQTDSSMEDVLREAGIPGIRYLDQGSRGAPPPTVKPVDGGFELYWGNDPRPVDKFTTREAADAAAREIDGRSSNYVVFDDRLVSIIKKYGIAGAAAMLGMSAEDLQAQAAQQEQPLGDYLNQ